MRAVTCQEGALAVTEVAEPRPDAGHLLLEVVRTGICGSDLHARTHADEVAEATRAGGYEEFMRAEQSVVLGHEFCGEVLEAGRGAGRGFAPGALVVSMPLLRVDGAVHPIGLSVHAPGSYAERLRVQGALSMVVPNGLDPDVAALTEPLAVALHAVRRGQVGKRDVAVVIGCGPIGLGVIAQLKSAGVRTVVASDLSPARRALASTMGADVVVDPEVTPPFDAAGEHGRFYDTPALFGLAVDTMTRLRSVPGLPWARLMQAAERLGAVPGGPVVFECVGVPGMIDSVVAAAPLNTRVVVVGVCMGADRIRPAIAINKEVDLRFVLGYTPREFHETLHLLAEGDVDPRPLLTGTVGLEGVEAAFDTLAAADRHAKILIDPRQPGAEVTPR